MPYSIFSLKIPLGRQHLYKSLTAAAAAALVAGLATGLAFGAPEGTAGIPSASAAKDDPRPGPANGAAACSQHAWPDYEPRCLFDATRSVGDVRKVRVIIMDGRKTQ
jgi:hypothetical protein